MEHTRAGGERSPGMVVGWAFGERNSEREKEKSRLCLKTIQLGPKFETKLMFERKNGERKKKWLGDLSFSSLKMETKEFSFKLKIKFRTLKMSLHKNGFA
jgi:hypothetical protein